MAEDPPERLCKFNKTRMCKFHLLGMCTKGPHCNFAHDPVEIQKLPDLRFTKVCKTLIETGQCTNRSCTYAHSKEEFRPKGAFHKTRFCRFIQTGYCTLGNACNFAHSQDELRNPETLDSMMSPPRDSNEKLAAMFLRGEVEDQASIEFGNSSNEPAYVRVPWDGQTGSNREKKKFTSAEREACASLAYATALADLGGSRNTTSFVGGRPVRWNLRDMTIDQKDEWQARECCVFRATMPGMRPVRTSESTLCTLGDVAQM